MKTLDEVIAKIEAQWVCPGSDYADEYCELYDVREDALHYLKEYRSDQLEWEANRKQWDFVKDDLTALRAYWAEQQANPPLTWDELKQMEGKPVWVEMPNSGYWIIIDRFGLSKNDGTEYMETMQNRFWKENYGSWWKAYKRETK